jgi:phenylalanine-4-hydroxylase
MPSTEPSSPHAPADPTAQGGLLPLDPKHPGIDDLAYRERRTRLYHLAREHRLAGSGIPRVGHTDEEHRIWRHVSRKLEEVHRRRACSLYLRCKQRIGLGNQAMPELQDLHAKVQEAAGLSLVPAEGLIPPREFFAYLAERTMPCTQYLRHHSRPAYTPEPDAVHDVIGHVPYFMDRGYGEMARLLGKGGAGCSEEQITAFERFYWFGIEFGLIEEEGSLKVFGAGILSSFGEMEHSVSGEVEHRPFSLEEVIETDFDTTVMQEKLFVIRSLDHLAQETARLLDLCGGARRP